MEAFLIGSLAHKEKTAFITVQMEESPQWKPPPIQHVGDFSAL